MNRKLVKITAMIVLFAIAAGNISAEGKKTVAVINFSNETGGEGLAYLSSALSDSVTATLSANEKIQTVERRQISAVIDEIKLDLTGLVSDEALSRAGRITSAEIIIAGSYTGNPEKITVNMKAVNVETAEVIYGKVMTAGLGEIFDIVSRETNVFASVITGDDTGRISVSTVPSGADIYIDGTMAGKTPLVEYLIPAGSHRLKIVKKGYREEERNFIVETDKHKNIGVSLIEEIKGYPWNASAGAMYKKPFNAPSDSDIFKSSLEIPLSVSYTFDRFTVEGGYSFTRMDHGDTIESVWGDKEQDRWYTMNSFTVSFLYTFIDDNKYFAPYGGIFLGGTVFSDNRKNPVYDNEKENLDRFGKFVIGPRLGINFIPDYRLRPFIETLFYIYPSGIERKTYTLPPLGGALQETVDKYRYFGICIGAGLRYSFR